MCGRGVRRRRSFEQLAPRLAAAGLRDARGVTDASLEALLACGLSDGQAMRLLLEFGVN